MKIGLEIESIVDRARLTMEVGDYHHGIPISGLLLNSWKAEHDGSLYPTRDVFPNQTGIEFVSNIYPSQKEAMAGLKQFKRIVCTIGKSKKLNELMYFNTSCGAHIHFELEKYKFWDYASKTIFEKTTKQFFELLEKNKYIS